MALITLVLNYYVYEAFVKVIKRSDKGIFDYAFIFIEIFLLICANATVINTVLLFITGGV